MKGLDNLYTRGSEVTIPHALQLEDYEKEQTLFESNTFDEKLSDHIETSPEMSPSHLHEEIDNLSNNVPSLVSIIAFKPESKATTNFTKTDERESQSSGLITLSPMEDSSYHEMQYSPGVLHTSRCLSDSGATEHAEN